MKKILALIAATTLLCLAMPAAAELADIGEPVEGNSFYQTFGASNEFGILDGVFDMIAVRVVSGGPLVSPNSLTNFDALLASDASWQQVFLSGDNKIAAATGDATIQLEWRIHFQGGVNQSLTFDYVAFKGNTIVDSARVQRKWFIVWYWDINNHSNLWNPTRSELGGDSGGGETPIPVPGAVALGMIGLGLVGWRTRRRA